MTQHKTPETPMPAHNSDSSGKATSFAGRHARWILLLIVIAASMPLIKYGRHHVFPKRFHVVEPGALYRSGRLERGPLRHVLGTYEIRTIVSLLSDEPDRPSQQAQERVASEMGVRILRFPMPGDGRGHFDALDAAADILADTAYHPILVHCAAGVHRTGAVFAAYRVKHCGWDLQEALAEGDIYGCSYRDKTELIEHLQAYYRQRIAPPPIEPASMPARATTCGALRVSMRTGSPASLVNR